MQFCTFSCLFSDVAKVVAKHISDRQRRGGGGMFPFEYLIIVSFSYFPDTTKDVEAPKRIKRKTDRLTAYACEDSTLNITCGQDLYLDVIRANYGRFSITICNDHGNTDWKVDCQAGRTLRAMQARCSNQHDCIVPVQSSIFGDPCPGTFKYIEVHYACRKGTEIF